MPKKKGELDWEIVYRDMSLEGIRRSFMAKRQYSLGKDQYNATLHDNFNALAIAIRDRLIERWILTQQRYHKQNLKRVYYLSLEFLIGRLLGTNILNLGIGEEVKTAVENLGLDLEQLRECESDAGLGNGGLGRLAACFLDSMALLGIPAHGYGIRYDYGIFDQKIINGYQVEKPDNWLSRGNPWEFARLEYTVKIKFYGRSEEFIDSEGKKKVKWVDTDDVLAVPYDIPVLGFKNDVVNTLRLWSVRSSEEFDLQYFNDGDYERAMSQKVSCETISKVLYPNDNIREGKELRLKQEYFFTAASVADIIRRFKADNGDLKKLPQKAVIQLNDTHPALAIVELMRILIDEENLDWDTAWSIITSTFAYTNHTMMPEALEKWPVPLLEKLLPRHMQLIYQINTRSINDISAKFPGDIDRIRRASIIEESDPKKIRMASLCIIGSRSVNGVSELHSELLRTRLFKDFFEFSPEKFNSKTNGITPRRWLYKANPRLSKLIDQAIGESWIIDASKLSKLSSFKDNRAFQDKWWQVKQENKKDLAKYIYHTTGRVVNQDSLFDVQVKRMHEYKRQLLFGLFMIYRYWGIKNNSPKDVVPRTFIVGGKAAPGYFMAKRIIKFINNIAGTINADPAVGDKLKVVFLENYRVSLAEKIFPAADLSEQISCAGCEASGTGNMKFMMNAALTIGTYDGANIEIAEAVGEDNIFIFGLKVAEIENLRRQGYDPKQYIQHSFALAQIIELIQNNYFSPSEKGIFEPLLDDLRQRDYFFVCADFDNYCQVQDRVDQLYRNRKLWTEKSIINVAGSGRFSSDRTVINYAREIWKVPYKYPALAKK